MASKAFNQNSFSEIIIINQEYIIVTFGLLHMYTVIGSGVPH